MHNPHFDPILEAQIDELKSKNESLKNKIKEMEDALKAIRGAYFTPITLMKEKKENSWDEYKEDAKNRTLKILGGYY